MAYVVPRRRRRWEIRESYSTPAGPRARTLASFTTLTPEVVDRAAAASRRGLDREGLLRAARRAGVPLGPRPPDELAASLIRRLARGEAPRRGLCLLLRDRLAESPRGSIDDELDQWIGASAEERGAALVDLLGLVDRLPSPPRRRLTFPGLSPTRLRR